MKHIVPLNLHILRPYRYLTTFTSDDGVRLWRLVENGHIRGATTPDLEAVLDAYSPRPVREVPATHVKNWREQVMVWHADIRGGVLLQDIEAPLPDVGYQRENLLGDVFVVLQSALMDPFCRCGRPLLSCPQTSRICSSMERTRHVRLALEKRDDAC